MANEITTEETRRAYLLAGNCTITLTSVATGARFTYKVSAPSERTDAGGYRRDTDAGVRFVKVLTGSDNCGDYEYAAIIRKNDAGEWVAHHGGQRARIGRDAASVKALLWFWRNAASDAVEVRHAGNCGRCGRTLTVDESIDAGLGPKCRGAS
jgi:hypothetical protein